MGKVAYMKLRGSQSLRLRLLLSTLSSTPILIEDIRVTATAPGLRSHEISFLRLLEEVCDGCIVEINETGTKLKYVPGIVMGGKNLFHDCGVSRSIGYFLEPLIVLALFGKKPLEIKLIGITHDAKDPTVDTFQSTTLSILQRFGVSQDLRLKIENRGVAPGGGGEVFLKVPILQDSLKAIAWTEEGMVKEISGVTFSIRVSRDFENSMIYAARGIFNRLLPHVHIHKAGSRSGKSPGYGISLYAETTSGCRLSVDNTISYSREGDLAVDDDDEKKDLNRPDDVGVEIASLLLAEIEQGGVVDSSHQGLLFLLCALCPQDVSKVRVGKLTPYGIETLRHIRDFLGVKFDIKPQPSTGTLILKCVGCGLRNLSRKVS